MLKRILVILLLILTIPVGLVQAQITDATPVPFDIAAPRDNIISGVAPDIKFNFGPYSSDGRNIVKSVSRLVSLDSLVNQLWTVDIRKVVSTNTYEALVTGRHLKQRRPAVSYTTTFTTTTGDFAIPDRIRSSVAGFRRDSVFLVEFVTPTTSMFTAGDDFYLMVSREVPIKAHLDGFLAVYDTHPVDTVTILSSLDSLTTLADTFYTNAVSGGYTTDLLYIDAYAPTGTAQATARVHYQLQVNGVWAGGVVTATDTAIQMDADADFTSNQPRVMAVSKIGYADSLRFMFAAQTAAYRSFFRKIMHIGRK